MSAICRRQFRTGVTKGIKLHPPITLGDYGFRKRRDFRRLALGLIPAVGVRQHSLMKLPANQLPHRHAQRLADDVPAGDVKTRERRLRHFAWPIVFSALDVPGEPLHIERVRADDVARRQFVDAGKHGLGAADHPHFADADQAVVRLEFKEHQLAPGCADDRGSCSRNLHARSFGRRLAGRFWNTTGRRNRLMAVVPTEVCNAFVLAGYGPPWCIAGTTATPVG